MKTLFHAAAILLAICTGCQSPSFLADRLGQSPKERLSKLKKAADQTDPGLPGLPRPTNLDPRRSAVSTASVDEHLRLGEAELSKDRKREALEHFQKALDAAPQHAEANHRMAVVYDKLSQFDKARTHYAIALQNDPRNVAVLSDLGYSYWLQGRYPESERFLLQALEVDPHYETAVANLGMLYGSTGRQEEALAMFRKIGDEAQVQQIMQRVAAMSAPTQPPTKSPPESPFPAASGAGVMPAGLVDDSAPQFTESAASFETSGDVSHVNEPTRELLDLMEQSRRQQQHAAPPQRQDDLHVRTPQPVPSAALPAAQQSSMPRVPRAQISGVHPFAKSAPGLRSSGPQRVPDHLLNHALADIDREGQRLGRPITIGPNTSPQRTAPLAQQQAPRSFPVHQAQAAAAEPPLPASNENWWESNAPRPSTGIDRAPVLANPPNTTLPQQAGLGAQQRQDEFLSQSHAVSTTWQDQGTAPQADITYGEPQSPTQFAKHAFPSGQTPARTDSGPPLSAEFAERAPDQPHRRQAVQQASGTMPEQATGQQGEPSSPVQQPVDHAYHQQQLGAASAIDLLHGTTVDQTDPRSHSADSSTLTPGSQWPLVQSAEANPADAYLQARRQAALMALRAGPGEMFPYIQQTQRVAAGTASRWNGAEYPPPTRYLPADLTVSDRDSTFPAPPVAHAAPGKSLQSQVLPYGANRINHPRHDDMRSSDSLGTAHRFTPQYRTIPQPRRPMLEPHQLAASRADGAHPQAATERTHNSGNRLNPSPDPTRESGAPATPSHAGVLQSYDDVRQHHNQQMNGLINQTYGQSRQSPPYSVAAPHSHAINTPAETPAMPPSWNRQSPASGTYRTSPPIEGQPVQSSGSSPSKFTVPSASTFVVPEPYHGQRNTAQRQHPQMYQSIDPPSSDAYHGPTIVPSAR